MFRTTNPLSAPRKSFRIRWGNVAACAATAVVSAALTYSMLSIASESPQSPETPATVVVPSAEPQGSQIAAQRCTEAYAEAVAAVMAAGEAGEDLTASLIELAEADNRVRFEIKC